MSARGVARVAAAVLWMAGASLAQAQTTPTREAPAEIRAGTFLPLFGAGREPKPQPVAAFRIDRTLVTNRAFARFVAEHPEWRRGAVPELFADERYLSATVDDELRDAPVVFVSWFAARAYCEARGGRLPTTLEWEYVAAADAKRTDASRDPAFVKRILEWYGKPFRPRDLVAARDAGPNAYGVSQLHTLVWEWTEDFNGVFLTGDNRQDGDSLPNLFCGAGSAAGATREDYAAFMRYALRSSLRGNYALTNLGFRCAYDARSAP